MKCDGHDTVAAVHALVVELLLQLASTYCLLGRDVESMELISSTFAYIIF